MTTRPNKAGYLEAPSLRWPPPGTGSTVVRLEDLDPWHAASRIGDLFDRRLLWAGDGGRTRFAALGERCRVSFDELRNATAAAAEEFELPAAAARQLPLGLFVLGETDDRPAAFEFGEGETRPHCWTPQALLIADGNSSLLYCADPSLRRHLVQRLEAGTPSSPSRVATGCAPELRETPLDSQDTWTNRVDRSLAEIRQGNLEKLVVSRRLVFQPSSVPFSPWESTWQASRASGRIGFSISLDRGESMFVGATPETLLKIQDGSMRTHALAGTRERDASLEDFLVSSKLAREHTLVSDGLVARLGPLVRNVRPGPLRVRRSGLVSHLETPLSGELREGVDPLQILADLHPTAAIGGLPQRAAQAALRDIEPYSRGWFAAPFGWLAANGNLHAGIAIRSVWVSGERAVALAGAGIVEGSVAAEEWAETESKFDNMRAVIRGHRFGA